MTIEDLVGFLLYYKMPLSPCTEKEIEYVEQYYNTKLPDDYKCFLRHMGRGAGQFLCGSSIFYDEIFDLKEAAHELVIEDNLPDLPADAFVFWMHQGYQMAFFRLNGDNSIYFFNEGQDMTGYEKTANNLADFLFIQTKVEFGPKYLEHWLSAKAKKTSWWKLW